MKRFIKENINSETCLILGALQEWRRLANFDNVECKINLKCDENSVQLCVNWKNMSKSTMKNFDNAERECTNCGNE